MRLFEGVQYHRFLVRYRDSEGKRRKKVLWTPGLPWVSEAVDRAGLDIAKGTNVYIY